MSRLRLATALLAAVPLVACGGTLDGGSPAGAHLAGTPSPQSGRSSSSAGHVASEGPATDATSVSTAGSPIPLSSEATPGVDGSRAVTVSLGHACVAPGGYQSIIITVTNAPASVSYSAHYADGKLGMDYGGVGIGQTNESGLYRSGWEVSPKAALGDAYVMAGASRSGTTWTAAPVYFTVSAHC